MPSTGQEEETPQYLLRDTASLKAVSDYCGLDFCSCLELDCYTYKLLIKDALIYKLSKTQEGQEYLENCWILTQTAPDKERLRKKFNK